MALELCDNLQKAFGRCEPSILYNYPNHRIRNWSQTLFAGYRIVLMPFAHYYMLGSHHQPHREDILLALKSGNTEEATSVCNSLDKGITDRSSFFCITGLQSQ
jgi:hypothetical protein